MRSAAIRSTGVVAALLTAALTGVAQQRPAGADPRVGLKAGLRDAGTAARNMQLVASLPKPPGFFDPKAPAGPPTPPERDPNLPPEPPPDPAGPPPPNLLGFANSDLAFSANHAVMGNYHGFNFYDVENPGKPRLASSVVCPGGQGDVSIYGHLLFMSVEQVRGRLDCGTQGVPDKVSTERFRGIRIFDITDITKPKQIAAVQTCRGSHTHTLVANPKDTGNLFIYGSGTGAVRAGEELAGCSGLTPEEDPNTSLFSIDVIQVPLDAPEKAKLVNRPRIFADENGGNIAALWKGGNHGEGTQKTSVTNQCHDITVYPEMGLAAGACSGNGILLDISDPVHPVRLDAVADNSFAYWHSATFNNTGTKVIFTDEWGGGSRPRCRATDPPTWGADAIFDIVDHKLHFAGYYKLPAPQSETENCVAHNGGIIPVPGRDIMAQAWYQGGVSVFDFTDSAHPVEIAFFDRGPVDAKTLITAGYWSVYWYNGALYGSEIARGVDVFRLTPSEFLSQNEIAVATLVRSTEYNPQEQSRIVYPDNSLVARAYLDQLARSKTIQPERSRAVSDALDRADKNRNAAGVAERLETMAADFEREAGGATATDAARMKALAATLRSRARSPR
jgi:hypothetical protein